MANIYYLSQSGETSGPFTENEFQAIRDRGELKKYQLVWDGSAEGWKPLAPPPPPGPPTLTPVVSVLLDTSNLEALCFDLGHALKGKLERVTETGCEFVAAQSEESGSSFSQDAPVTLNLLNPKDGRSMNVSAKMTGVARKNGNWTYQIQWKSRPEIVL